MVNTQGKNRYRGMVAVEAALVFPVLLLLTLGALRYGVLFLKAQKITNATRVAARIAIRPGITNEEVETVIDNLMAAAGMGDSGYQITITPEDLTDLSVGEAISVAVSVPVDNIDALPVPLLSHLEPENIGAICVMAREGFFTSGS